MSEKQETSWYRLWDIAEARRSRLGITQTELQSRGGPSTGWVRKLHKQQGAPSTRHAASLRDLDTGLGWPEGTSWDLVTGRAGWTPEQLAEEKARLVNLPLAGAAEQAEEQVQEQAEEQVQEQDNHPDESVPIARLASVPTDADSATARETLARVAINSVCDSTLNGWLYFCDEHDTHGNADSKEEAEWMADAHVSFYADQEEGESDPCEVLVWSRRQGPINQLAE